MRHKDEDEDRWRRPPDEARTLIAEHNKMKEKKDREDFDFIAKEKERLSREKSVSPTRPSVAEQSLPRTYTRSDSTHSTSSPTRIKRPEYYSSELKLPTYEAASRFLNSASTSLSQKPLARSNSFDQLREATLA